MIQMNVLNGPVLMNTINTAFSTRELAKKALEKTKQVNKDCEFILTYNIHEINVYENESEVPIMNQ